MVRKSDLGRVVLLCCLGLSACQNDVVYLKEPLTIKTISDQNETVESLDKAPIVQAPNATLTRIQQKFNAPLSCQATVLQPAVFGSRTKKVLVQEGVRRYSSKSAVTQTNSVKIQTMPARFAIETVPAVYKTIVEKIAVKRERPELQVEPPQYRTVITKQEIKPAHLRWRAGCLSPTDVKDSTSTDTRCVINQTPQYAEITQQVVDIPPTFTWRTIPAEYVDVERKVLVKSGKGTGLIPAEYRNVDLHHVVNRWTVGAADLSHKYQEITVQVLERPARVLRQVSLCEAQLSETDIKNLQRRLAKLSGQDLTVNGKMDGATRIALLRFQEQQRLAQGAMTLETLQALGFE